MEGKSLFIPRHQLVPPFRLRIRRILDLQPADAITFVDAVLPLRHDSFQIVGADFLKKDFAIAFDMLSVDDSSQLVRSNQLAQMLLPLYQRHVPQIFTASPQQIEGVEHRCLGRTNS
jgi:hypothetical protein